MRNIVVASTLVHAKAIIRWAKLSPLLWETAKYGDELGGRFAYARIVRPLGEVHDWQIDWILEELIPRIDKKIIAIPLDWALKPQAAEGPQYPRNEVFL